jgi:branched-subunit amino acid aminotransferase/4-amino-4-deoxychorismate lyase
MPEPLAFLNGVFVPAAQAVVPVDDAGFMLGVTVPEQLRTFGGKLFRLDEHLARLARGLEIVGVTSPHTERELFDFARELVKKNHALLPPGEDLGLTIFVTPGPATIQPGRGPLVCMHTRRLPWASHTQLYERGQNLVTTKIRQVPTDCWPAELKCRSRMHYWLADHEARRIEPGARALLLDHDDFVLEASTANILIYRAGEGLISPPKESILPGISVAMLADLAQTLGLPFLHRSLRLEDLLSAEEVLLCSTSPCVWPVLSLNGKTIGSGQPGAIFSRLIAAWSQHVGMDIVEQAQRLRLV